MSERFVEAFAVSPAPFAELLGTPTVGFAAVRKRLGRKPIWEDLVSTLGDGDEVQGLADVEAGLDALAAGKSPRITYVERLTQLLLHAYAEPLKPSNMEANFMPAHDDGLWTPAFAALGMKTIAKQWGKPNFPRKRGRSGFGWPVITIVETPALAAWQAELATPWRARLATLSHATFDPEADDEDPYMSREEVEAGLAVLAKWVTAATKRGSALVLVLDGDQ